MAHRWSTINPTRRSTLKLLGAAVLAPQVHAQTASGSLPACIVTPEQTEGPYFVDTRLNRSDIRRDPSDGSVKEGVPLALQVRVLEVRDNRCTPIAGAMVDIWHCDAAGVYLGVADSGANARDKMFLRGYQLTDANGIARFQTIYPGAYPGRAVHIHFKVRTDAKSASAGEFTSQMYFDDAINERILTRPPYAAATRRVPRNQSDGLFRHGGKQLMLSLQESAQGYTATFDIGLRA